MMALFWSEKRRVIENLFNCNELEYVINKMHKFIPLFSVFISHEVSSYLYQKILYLNPFLGIITKVRCYETDIKELSSKEELLTNKFLFVKY
jgi:hypothetical protein